MSDFPPAQSFIPLQPFPWSSTTGKKSFVCNQKFAGFRGSSNELADLSSWRLPTLRRWAIEEDMLAQRLDLRSEHRAFSSLHNLPILDEEKGWECKRLKLGCQSLVLR
mmetsp:Transcript_18261/g.60000  ORF Transcript_18261/g.60000 Transcript_18261/m.60000 type:complete len:108 (-) Transcript_18261:503-826(-)